MPTSKQKTTTKRASLNDEDEARFGYHAIVWARIKGYPYWPAYVLEENDVNDPKLKKPANKNAVLVKFFETGEYAYVEEKKSVRMGL